MGRTLPSTGSWSGRRALAVAALAGLAALDAAAGRAGAQTPGTVANDPFPFSISPGVTVRIGDVATVPNSSGAKARLNSSALSPDGRMFVVDQRGPVYTLGSTGGGSVTPYLNLANVGLNLLNDNGERGAATLAFHPQFTQAGSAGYGKFYAAFSTNASATTPDAQVNNLRDHDEVVYEFTAVNPLAGTYTPGAAPREVLRIARPNSNHNGGGLGFNPNAAPGSSDYGLLYVSTGDSGGGGDPYAVAQNTASLMGKILRIDPTAPANSAAKYSVPAGNAFAADGDANTRGEIFATGFRNPQRFSWDAGGAKSLIVGDVGQNKVEEVDVVANGLNYGWGVREGSFVYNSNGTVSYAPNPDKSLYTRPIAEYDHDEGNAVSGGFVYRGTAIPALTGKYVFGDLVRGRLFYIDPAVTNGGQAALKELLLTQDGQTTQTLLQLISAANGTNAARADLRLGQDALGNLYVLNKQDGIVRELLPAAVPEPATLAGAGAVLLVLRRRARAR